MAKGNRAYRKAPKKRSVNRDMAVTYKAINDINRRLSKLGSQGFGETWASKKLLNRLKGGKVNVVTVERTKGGQVKGLKLKKKLTKTEMIAVQKASRQFLASKTSTAKGIRSVREETIKSLQSSMSDTDKELSYEEAEALYDMLGDNDFDDFVAKVGASTMWNLIDDAIEARDSETAFLNRLERYAITLNDVDLREKAKRIYEKYVV